MPGRGSTSWRMSPERATGNDPALTGLVAARDMGGAREPGREPRTRVGLVLAGGAARGAYEVGALSVLLPALERRGERPSILVGASVGAINAANFGGSAHLPAEEAIDRAVSRWQEVRPGRVIRPLTRWQIPLTAVRYAGQVLAVPGVRLGSLLDPTPLARNLQRWIDWPRLHGNVADGLIGRLAVIATSASSGRSVAFVEDRLRGETNHSHVIDYVPARLGLDHVRASAAIPMLFPPVRIEDPASARGWYFDGGARLNTPIKPALDLGAERLVIVATDSVSRATTEPGRHDASPPDVGDGALLMLQGALVDRLIEDVRMLGEINVFFADGTVAPGAARYRQARGKPPYRRVPYILVAPQRPGAIGELAAEVFRSRYRGIRGLRSPDLALLNRLLGSDSPTHGELLSYLLFDREFIDELIAMGREDARRWLRSPPGPDEPWQVEPLDEFLARPSPDRIAPSARQD
jgi:NTE family protein